MVKKPFEVDFLIVVKYPKWVANIVPIPKKDKNVRMCVNYQNLYKTSPKDDFPMPHTNVLMYNTIKHSRFSLMNSFSGYN